MRMLQLIEDQPDGTFVLKVWELEEGDTFVPDPVWKGGEFMVPEMMVNALKMMTTGFADQVIGIEGAPDGV